MCLLFFWPPAFSSASLSTSPPSFVSLLFDSGDLRQSRWCPEFSFQIIFILDLFFKFTFVSLSLAFTSFLSRFRSSSRLGGVLKFQKYFLYNLKHLVDHFATGLKIQLKIIRKMITSSCSAYVVHRTCFDFFDSFHDSDFLIWNFLIYYYYYF